MVAPYRVENHAFRPAKPRPWSASAVTLPRILAGHNHYALHPDGRVAIADTGQGEALGQTHLAFIFDFFEELRRVAPPKP